jgi:hypothetical protein
VLTFRFLLMTSTIPLLVALGTAGCVPSNPSEAAPGATSSKPAKQPKKRSKSSATKPRSTRTAKTPRPRPGPMITTVFEDAFDRTDIGANWNRLGNVWKIKDGKLCGQGARNKGVWLRRRLPVNARIEFEATSDSPDGDIKAELWGDGMSGATSSSYTNATSYLTIFGGWKNTFHVLARIDEHAKDRLELRIDPNSAEERARPVVPGRVYAFRIEREDGKTISWSVDGHLIHRLEDPKPLAGKGHEHFGFNDWDVPVCFDNVRITPL